MTDRGDRPDGQNNRAGRWLASRSWKGAFGRRAAAAGALAPRLGGGTGSAELPGAGPTRKRSSLTICRSDHVMLDWVESRPADATGAMRRGRSSGPRSAHRWGDRHVRLTGCRGSPGLRSIGDCRRGAQRPEQLEITCAPAATRWLRTRRSTADGQSEVVRSPFRLQDLDRAWPQCGRPATVPMLVSAVTTLQPSSPTPEAHAASKACPRDERPAYRGSPA